MSNRKSKSPQTLKKPPKRMEPTLTKNKKRRSDGKKSNPAKKKLKGKNAKDRKFESTSNSNNKRSLDDNQKKTPRKKKKPNESADASDKEEDSQNTDILSQCNNLDGTPIVIKPPKNNIIHKSWMSNVAKKNYHEHNKVNTNKNMVGLQIPLKYLTAAKPKKESALEMKNQLVKQNKHLQIKKASTMETHLFNVWLWDSLTFYLSIMISATIVSTLNHILQLKGINF